MTDKKDEALKLALEALNRGETKLRYEAIAAIKEALAEHPAQQQEPVATVTSESGNPNVAMSWWHEPALPVGTKLYTSPQPSKPWVGLTDEEMHECWGDPLTPLGMKHARLIEAKLKEKNG
jgi:hypothetical protein